MTILVDLDGTICDISHRLHHVTDGNKDWDAFYAACPQDVPKQNIIELVHCLWDGGHDIIITSGRSDQVRQETMDWLKKHGVPYDNLIMRPVGNFMPDQALKKAWLDEGLLGKKESILFVLDDRQKVVDMWRQIGITCLQVDAWEEE